jgi:ABC-type proline/glycine betaine transport system ATPase subunit
LTFDENENQNLKSKLREIKNSLITQPSERHIEPLTEFLKKFVSEDGSYDRADANSKELLSRQILEVLLVINDKKDDK